MKKSVIIAGVVVGASSASSSSAGKREHTDYKSQAEAGATSSQQRGWTASSLGEPRPKGINPANTKKISTNPSRAPDPKPTGINGVKYARRLNPAPPEEEREDVPPPTTSTKTFTYPPARPPPPRVFDESGKELARDVKTGKLLALYNPRTKKLNRLFDEKGVEYIVEDVTRLERSHEGREAPRVLENAEDKVEYSTLTRPREEKFSETVTSFKPGEEFGDGDEILERNGEAAVYGTDGRPTTQKSVDIKFMASSNERDQDTRILEDRDLFSPAALFGPASSSPNLGLPLPPVSVSTSTLTKEQDRSAITASKKDHSDPVHASKINTEIYRSAFHHGLPPDIAVRQVEPGVFVLDRESALAKDKKRVQKLLEYSLATADTPEGGTPTAANAAKTTTITETTRLVSGNKPGDIWTTIREQTTVLAGEPPDGPGSGSVVVSTISTTSMISSENKPEGPSRGSSPPSSSDHDRSDCFYGKTVCSECSGRSDCLSRNQLNLADYYIDAAGEQNLIKERPESSTCTNPEQCAAESLDSYFRMPRSSAANAHDAMARWQSWHKQTPLMRESTRSSSDVEDHSDFTASVAANSGGRTDRDHPAPPEDASMLESLKSWRRIGADFLDSLRRAAFSSSHRPPTEQEVEIWNRNLEQERDKARRQSKRNFAKQRLLGIGKKEKQAYTETGALALDLPPALTSADPGAVVKFEQDVRSRLDRELEALGKSKKKLTPRLYEEILEKVGLKPKKSRIKAEPLPKPLYLKRNLQLTGAQVNAWKRSMGFTEECIDDSAANSTASGCRRTLVEGPVPETSPHAVLQKSVEEDLDPRLRGVLAGLVRQIAADRRGDLRRLSPNNGSAKRRSLQRSATRTNTPSLTSPGGELVVRTEAPALTVEETERSLSTRLVTQRKLQTYLKQTFTGQSDQCLCYHENLIFKPVLDLFPVQLPLFRECLTKHFAMGTTWQGVCTLDDACKYASRIAAEMQLVATPDAGCNCELCVWGEAWHATGQASSQCPNNHAELWREICQPCMSKSSVDIAALSDANVPKRERFEKIGEKGECTDKSLRYVRGRGKQVASHLECRDSCWQGAGLNCLGYSFYHCSKRCIIHLKQDGMHLLSNWAIVKGQGDVVYGSDGACGSECYRVTYGECPPGRIASGGVDVTWDTTMVYGQSFVETCPSPYTGQVTITCAGANSQSVEGMCLEPCPSGQLIYRPGLSPIAYPVTPIATRRRLPCPFDPNCPKANIELLCQSDRSILVVSPNCGASCAPGMYALNIGGGIVPYNFMKHRQKVPLFDCPFGYVGKLDLICVDGQVQEQPTPGTGCFLHCSSQHTMNVDRSGPAQNTTQQDVQLQAVFDLSEPQWLTNPSRVYMNDTLVLASQTQFMEGVFFKHGTILDVPCKPSPLTYGVIKVSCDNGIIAALSENCKFNCPAGTIEAATGGHTLKMYHGYLDDWHSVKVQCPSGQWTGNVELSCRNGVLSRKAGDVCMRHCNVEYLVSNGLNIYLGTQLQHDSRTNVTCSAGGNPNFAGKLEVVCFNGQVSVIGRCGQFCAPTMIVSNDAMVLTYRQDHDETRGYTCPSPWTGTLTLKCNDQQIEELASCGQMCAASTFLVRGITNMPFPKATDRAVGMLGIGHGEVYEAGCPEATDALSYTGTMFLYCNNGEVSKHSGECWWNCDKLIINSGGFPQAIEFLKHNTTDMFTCAAGLDTGYLRLLCFHQELTILEGSCASSPCQAGVVEQAATRFLPLQHPLIFHLGSVHMQCPEPLTGDLTLACNKQEITVPYSNCGDRCQINGTILPTINNELGLSIYGGVRIFTPKMDHSTTQTLPCPANTKGTVDIQCKDGTPTQVAGGCNNPCPPTLYTTPTGALIPMPYMEHDETSMNVPCPLGTTMGGTVNITCVNGTHQRTGGVCLTNCPAREFTSNTVNLRHPSIAHGQMYEADCGSWNLDYTGRIKIFCFQGAVNETGRCSRHCAPGSVVSNGATVPHEKIEHGTNKNLTCSLANVGTIDFAHEMNLACNDGAVSMEYAVQNGARNVTGTCMRNCLGPTKLFGTTFRHPKIIDGTMIQVDCAGPGKLVLQCNDGIASPYNSKCFQTCPPDTLIDARGIAVTWVAPPITHDTIRNAECDATVASGTAEVKCLDGIPRIQASFCKLNCYAGSIQQPDPDNLYKYPIILSHGDLKHGETEEVACPSHLAGRATVQCDDSVVKIVAGSCGTSNCMPSELRSGEDLMIAYPQMNHAETYETDCGPGFIGRIKFRCNEGVAMREWIRMNYLNTVNNQVETVELCECCITDGISFATQDKPTTIGAGSDEAAGWASAAGLFSIVILAYVYYAQYWSKYVTPKIKNSFLAKYMRERKAKNAAAARAALAAKVAASQNVGISRNLEQIEDGESGSSASQDAAIEDYGYEGKVAPLEDGKV
ncbi:unnamed protein product [Amoebophrya sp. A120]|nr:unnamed protein product [Amoebophrya sp. A120]|eukprot:GSA120T00005483001.1